MPIERSDHTVNIESPEDLTGATVTIEYRNPNNQIVEDITPDNVDEDADIITYKLDDSITIKGQWKVWAKIVNADGNISYTDPSASINFKGRGL